MDIGKIAGKIPKWFQQYRYPILILLVGLVLLTIPTGKITQSKNETVATTDTVRQDASAKLAELLGQMNGVGKVKVLLTLSVGEKTIYHSDEDINTSESTSTIRKETVIITDSDRNQKPLISQVIPAEYRGAVIVCQGGDDPKVKWAVVEAVSKATGLGVNQISVLKMK